MSSRLHTCAAEGCEKQIASRLLMCIVHWRMVPKALQRLVYSTFRNWSGSRFTSGNAHDLYRGAVTQAVAAVREKEIKRRLRKDSTGDVLNFE
jgi:hypothetical protein